MSCLKIKIHNAVITAPIILNSIKLMKSKTHGFINSLLFVIVLFLVRIFFKIHKSWFAGKM